MTSIVVVTGGASGIGAAICTELAGRGYTVVVTDVDEGGAKAVAAGLRDSRAVRLDVTSASACREAVSAIEADIGPIAAWVSNAGVSRMARFLDIGEEQFDLTMDVNLRGLFFSGQAAARVMAKRKSGCIVNVASMAGKQGRVPFLADYVASKFAVVGLTQAMAFELAASGIRVNSVCPGFVATSMQVRELEWESKLRGIDADSLKRQWIADTPMGRLEEPQDVARVVAFLLSADAGFVTGESIAVNGGAFMD